MAFLTTKNIKGDIFGGVTAGIVALPLALAFGIQAFGGVDSADASSMGALAGLVGATLLGFFAALFGGTHSQISGPTGPMTVITASLVAGAWASSNGSISAVIIAMSMAGIFCGIFQILFGIMRIGKYVRYIPYPVLSGFMSGIGVIIILQQIYPLIGKKSPSSTLEMILKFPAALTDGISILALVLGVACIALIILVPKFTKKIPATLVALIVVTVVSIFTNIDPKLTIGEIPAGLPLPFFANAKVDLTGIDWFKLIEMSIVPGLTLAGLGSIDTLLTSVVADNITKTHHNSNKELIGQGIGNAIAGMFCGIAGAGATMRTVVNVKSGGRTQISGMVHAMFLLAILMGLGSLVKYVPLSVLAGILITVGWGIIDFRGFKDLRKVSRADAFVLITVFLMTVFVDLLTAVGIGMVIASVLFMKQMSDVAEAGYESMDATHEHSPWADEDGLPEDDKHKICVERFMGPIFFGSIAGFNKVMNEVPEEAEIVILRMKYVKFMDQSGAYAMETAVQDLQAQGKTVLMTIIQPQPMALLEEMGFFKNVVKKEHTFTTFEACTDFLKETL